MPDFQEAEQSAKGSLRETLRSLRATFAAAFALRPSLFVVVSCVLALALTQGIPVMHSTVLYTAVAAFFFLLLGCVLYTRKGAIEATVTFSVGMFTAFTVPWNRSYFIVFIIAILIFTVLIILFTSIRLAAGVQSVMTMAANFYSQGDHETNLQELKAVYESGKPGETLTSLDRANAILFFAQRKVPADIMNNLIRKVYQICTVTQVDQVRIETMLYKIYQAATNREDFDIYMTWTEEYLLEGPASPGELVDSFIHTSFMLSAPMTNFRNYLTVLTSGVARGYNREQLYQFMTREGT